MSLLDQLNRERMKSAQTPVLRRNRKILPSVRKGADKVTSWYSRSQRALMYVAGFGFLDAAAWQFDSIAGCAATGVSLLVLGTLTGGDDE